MIYSEFGNTGKRLSALGFGVLRMPMINNNADIDEWQIIPMLHRAFELGVNYVDTAPPYLNSKSEAVVGKALKGWRDKVYVSTKSQSIEPGVANWMKELEKSLRKLDVDYIDFYHMWGINLDDFKTKILAKEGAMKAAIKAKNEGLIKHISFSYHGKPEDMKEIVDTGYYESVLMQYNLLDRKNEDNIQYCKEKGLGVAIMGPVAGGRLGAPNSVIIDLLKGKMDVKSTAEMALRFVLANPGVNIALSGMQTIDMIEQNVRVASINNPLTETEIQYIEKMLKETQRLAELYCTGCNYCMPCPMGINIPYIFELINYKRLYQVADYAKHKYRKLSKEDSKSKNASVCVACGECEQKCPQKIKVINQLKEAHTELFF